MKENKPRMREKCVSFIIGKWEKELFPTSVGDIIILYIFLIEKYLLKY